jgi:hypothetical protein
VRARVGAVQVSLASRREPYASTDGALSFEDRLETSATYRVLTATAFAARTRWWLTNETPASIADTLGGELAVAAQLWGFDILARGAIGRSFYGVRDPMLASPEFGARVTLDVQRTFRLGR